MLSLDRQNLLREQYRTSNPGWRPATELFADSVRAQLTPSSRVLDLGCGRGGLVEQLTHPLEQIVGVDPDVESLHEHRLDLTRLAALGHLPFADESFDVIYASWVLEHWANPERDLREIGRILAPSGTFIFITPNKRAPLIMLNQVIGSAETIQKKLVSSLYARDEADTFPIHYRANDRKTLRQLAIISNLQLASCHLIPDPTYLAFNSTLFRIMANAETLIPQERKLHLVGILQKSVNSSVKRFTRPATTTD